MTSKNNYTAGKFSAESGKKPWTKPRITLIGQEKIREEEVELYYQLLANPELFQRIAESGASGA